MESLFKYCSATASCSSRPKNMLLEIGGNLRKKTAQKLVSLTLQRSENPWNERKNLLFLWVIDETFFTSNYAAEKFFWFCLNFFRQTKKNHSNNKVFRWTTMWLGAHVDTSLLKIHATLFRSFLKPKKCSKFRKFSNPCRAWKFRPKSGPLPILVPEARLRVTLKAIKRPSLIDLEENCYTVECNY